MKPLIISHRGNINGPLLEKENRPSYIDSALGLGYEVEVDIRYVDGQFWLGHDQCDYKINDDWIMHRSEVLWFHCKNLAAAKELSSVLYRAKYFCHTGDPYVLVSNGRCWVHDLSIADSNSIIPLISLEDMAAFDICKIKPYAICTDYVTYLNKVSW